MLSAVTSVAAARRLGNIVATRGVAEDLPFPDASFDIVATRYSAHHWHDLAVGLAGIRRVLKPGGVAVIMDVVSPGEALLDTFLQSVELLRDPSHIRDYSVSEWIAALRAAGLEPGAPAMARLRLEFGPWIARIGTPDMRARAVRALQTSMPVNVTGHFAIEPNGTFTVDTMMIEATI
jgi:SAM-dependent methyltransferase